MTTEQATINEPSVPAVTETSSAPGAESATTRFGPRSLTLQLERFGLLGLLLVVLLVFSLKSSQFHSSSNIRIVLGTQAVLGLLALASIVPLIAGQFDLSVGAIMGTTSIVTAAVMSRYHGNLALAILVAVGVGLLIGLVNGLLVSRVGVSSFIVTLASATVLQGVVQWYSNGETISDGISKSLISAGSGDALGIPKGLLWLLPAAVLSWYMIGHTPWGRYLTAIGSNARAAKLAGLRVDGMVLSSFLYSGALAGLAGVLQTGQAGSADPQSVLGAMLLPALAAAFLGASAFTPGRFNVWGTLLAVYFVAFTVSGFQFIGAASWIQQVFDGLALAGAVALSTILRRRNGRA
ncbi:monosaccharide ABC transporter membrane protein (CUT2 family) [Jatrophihabitans sp. GAS493]|uniref:ABC transporter permease n=1 Tax=Jatrophihabitans sp. GAS493 TaxID=1907575 RepID=UPI000BB7A8FF|nr:ABC transporter permease [Jatrophihabitans sp. GAS493]SOD71820.1 monosaccharide ABC transporter membrane protein (CUT2 family) [Jatrophihabitans sp. GAS493]